MPKTSSIGNLSPISEKKGGGRQTKEGKAKNWGGAPRK